MTTRTLLLLRHAQAGDPPPGRHDFDRPLTAHGEDQARAVGDFLRAEGIAVDTVLCSSSVRTRQTCALLELGDDVTVEVADSYYNAGSDTFLEAIAVLPDEVGTALIVGHAPGVPAVVYDLVDPASSEPTAFAAIESRFPPATLARLEFDGDWTDLSSARLLGARLGTHG